MNTVIVTEQRNQKKKSDFCQSKSNLVKNPTMPSIWYRGVVVVALRRWFPSTTFSHSLSSLVEKKIVGIDELTKRLEKSEWLKFKPFAVATRRREEDGEQDRDQPSNTRIIHNSNNTLKNEFLDYKYGCDQFSFFQTVSTFVTDYERCKAKNLCFVCEKRNMELYNVPCGCRIWCISWGEELSDSVHHCIICNAEVEKLELLSLPSSFSDNRQSIVNEIPVKTQAPKQRGKQRREIKMRMKMEEQKDEHEDGEGGAS
ncbi:hypothetical protein TEA_017111 [Camellia sinensis var. sinensis]|uniref:Uncharacterized protein n=1 Tax=Camellia sinensis var. sinensis TaxID=542762 RepID=A0A4S4D9Y4_CAMSN|nr:hypothetical protein TEA_017111 [Camellia sinensis var. sinensis]